MTRPTPKGKPRKPPLGEASNRMRVARRHLIPYFNLGSPIWAAIRELERAAIMVGEARERARRSLKGRR